MADIDWNTFRTGVTAVATTEQTAIGETRSLSSLGLTSETFTNSFGNNVRYHALGTSGDGFLFQRFLNNKKDFYKYIAHATSLGTTGSPDSFGGLSIQMDFMFSHGNNWTSTSATGCFRPGIFFNSPYASATIGANTVSSTASWHAYVLDSQCFAFGIIDGGPSSPTFFFNKTPFLAPFNPIAAIGYTTSTWAAGNPYSLKMEIIPIKLEGLAPDYNLNQTAALTSDLSNTLNPKSYYSIGNRIKCYIGNPQKEESDPQRWALVLDEYREAAGSSTYKHVLSNIPSTSYNREYLINDAFVGYGTFKDSATYISADAFSIGMSGASSLRRYVVDNFQLKVINPLVGSY